MDDPCSCSDYDSGSDDGCIFIDTSRARAPVTPFDAPTAGSSDDEGDFGGGEYETHTRNTLEALLDQAEAELYDEGGASSASAECRQWSRTFCHLRVRGRVAGGEPSEAAADDDDADAEERQQRITSCSGVATHCTLPVACSAVALQLEAVGTRCRPAVAAAGASDEPVPPHLEEVFASHGVHEEKLAAHCTGGPDATAAARLELSRARRLGMPPREPSLAVADGVVTRLVDACWRSFQPLMAGVPMLVAHVLARLSAPAAAAPVGGGGGMVAVEAPPRPAPASQPPSAFGLGGGWAAPPHGPAPGCAGPHDALHATPWAAAGGGGAKPAGGASRPYTGSTARGGSARLSSASSAGSRGSVAAVGIEIGIEVAGRQAENHPPGSRCGRAVATPPGGRPRPRAMPAARPARPPWGGAKDASMIPTVAGTGSRAASAIGGGARSQPAQQAPPARAVRGEAPKRPVAGSAPSRQQSQGRRAGSLQPASIGEGLRLPSIMVRGYS